MDEAHTSDKIQEQLKRKIVYWLEKQEYKINTPLLRGVYKLKVPSSLILFCFFVRIMSADSIMCKFGFFFYVVFFSSVNGLVEYRLIYCLTTFTVSNFPFVVVI